LGLVLTGEFNAATLKAVKAYQSKKSWCIMVDGLVGNQTLGAIRDKRYNRFGRKNDIAIDGLFGIKTIYPKANISMSQHLKSDFFLHHTGWNKRLRHYLTGLGGN